MGGWGHAEFILIGFAFSRDGNVCYDIRYFDMKLLFLLTAINCDIRAKVREEQHGLVYLVETLDLFMGQAAEEKEFSVSVRRFTVKDA